MHVGAFSVVESLVWLLVCALGCAVEGESFVESHGKNASQLVAPPAGVTALVINKVKTEGAERTVLGALGATLVHEDGWLITSRNRLSQVCDEAVARYALGNSDGMSDGRPSSADASRQFYAMRSERSKASLAGLCAEVTEWSLLRSADGGGAGARLLKVRLDAVVDGAENLLDPKGSAYFYGYGNLIWLKVSALDPAVAAQPLETARVRLLDPETLTDAQRGDLVVAGFKRGDTAEALRLVGRTATVINYKAIDSVVTKLSRGDEAHARVVTQYLRTRYTMRWPYHVLSAAEGLGETVFGQVLAEEHPLAEVNANEHDVKGGFGVFYQGALVAVNVAGSRVHPELGEGTRMSLNRVETTFSDRRRRAQAQRLFAPKSCNTRPAVFNIHLRLNEPYLNRMAQSDHAGVRLHGP